MRALNASEMEAVAGGKDLSDASSGDEFVFMDGDNGIEYFGFSDGGGDTEISGGGGGTDVAIGTNAYAAPEADFQQFMDAGGFSGQIAPLEQCTTSTNWGQFIDGAFNRGEGALGFAAGAYMLFKRGNVIIAKSTMSMGDAQFMYGMYQQLTATTTTCTP